MKKIIFTLLLSSSANIFASELCDSSKFKIEPDHQIPESHFTENNAKKALSSLSAYVSGSEKASDWTIVPNHLKTIQGYLLKKNALEEVGPMKELALAGFCLFMQKTAFIYD